MTTIDSVSRFPIRAEDIFEQAKLFRVERQALGLARYGNIGRISNGVNSVREICNGQKPHAYFKRGDGDEIATSRLEKLVWDLAALFGMQDLFVPTKLCRLRLAEQSRGGSECAVLWRPNQTQRWTNEACPPTVGSLQPSIEGMDLFDARGYGHEESLEHLADATVGILLMGGWDAHVGNIMVQPDGSYRLFDNSRSLPPNNDYHLYGDDLRVPYRSGFCSAEVYYQDFPGELRDRLAKRIETLQERVADVRNYFASTQVQRMLDVLPPGWWTKGCEEAMYERVQRLAEAIGDPRVKNLRDLSMAVFPQLRLAALVSLAPYLLHDKDVDRVQRNFMSQAAIWSLKSDLRSCANAGISVRSLKDLAESDLSFDELLAKAAKRIRHSDVDRGIAYRESQDLYDEMLSLAEVQLKDLARQHCGDYLDLRQWTEARFEEQGGWVLRSQDDMAQLPDNVRCCILHLGTRSLLVHYGRDGQLLQERIDFDSQPGKLVVGTKAWTPLQLSRLC